jgi:hypothetical protein
MTAVLPAGRPWAAGTATLARDYADLNAAIAAAGVTPATFRHVDVASNLLVAGTWADWRLLAGNRRNLELRCPIVRGRATGFCAPRLDLAGHSVRIHVRLDRIPALAFPGSAGIRSSADPDFDPLDRTLPESVQPISVIATSCQAGLWRYKLPGLLESWFNWRLADLSDLFSVVLADGTGEEPLARRR